MFWLFFTCHLYDAFVCFFDVLHVDAPWVSVQQFRVGLLELGQELLNACEHYGYAELTDTDN